MRNLQYIKLKPQFSNLKTCVESMKKPVFLLTLFLLINSTSLKAQLLINELMQSNVDCIMDDLNDFPDSWVELYNAGESRVDLSGYRLGVTTDMSESWKLPAKMIPPGGYVLIYCDKVGKGYHTDFRLESGKGCEVYLFCDGKVVDQVTGLKKQPAPNIAYGRKADAATEWGYQLKPTPAAQNCGEIATRIVGTPIFSTPGRVVTTSEPITLELSLPEGSPDGTEIRFTLNGSEPTPTSPLYVSPLTISNTTLVRATLFCPGCLSPRSVCHSYIFFPQDRPLSLPVVSIVTDESYFYDTKIGIYTVGDYKKNRNNYDFDWRRPINIEMFEKADTPSVINQLCETRIMGGNSRSAGIKSLAIYANKRFGAKRLEYEFFPDQRPGVTDFKSIALRNGGNDFYYLVMRDAIIQRTMAQHADLDWQAWRPVVLFINGVYRGILNIRDRSNADNVYTYYDGLEDIDMVENLNELKEGSFDNYNAFKAFYSQEGHTMQEYQEWMDCEEYINLMVMNIYFMNCDFPGKNIMMWRPRSEDGRWRWIAKDTDFGLGLYDQTADFNYIAWLYDPDYDTSWRNWANKPEHTLLFRHLMEDADFNREFIDHAAVYMGDFLNERGTRAVWDPMFDMVSTEMPFSCKIIGKDWDRYLQLTNEARSWLAARANYVYQHLADFYQLGKPIPLTINKTINTQISNLNFQFSNLRVNGIDIVKPFFDGMFFANRHITVIASDNDKQVTGWKTTMTKGGETTVAYVNDPEYSFSMPECDSLALEAVTTSTVGISEIPIDDGESQQVHGTYDLAGRHTHKPAKGIYIDRQGSKARKIKY